MTQFEERSARYRLVVVVAPMMSSSWQQRQACGPFRVPSAWTDHVGCQNGGHIDSYSPLLAADAVWCGRRKWRQGVEQ